MLKEKLELKRKEVICLIIELGGTETEKAKAFTQLYKEAYSAKHVFYLVDYNFYWNKIYVYCNPDKYTQVKEYCEVLGCYYDTESEKVIYPNKVSLAFRTEIGIPVYTHSSTAKEDTKEYERDTDNIVPAWAPVMDEEYWDED